MDTMLPQVSHFYAVEPNPSRDGHHVHALWTDPLVQRKQVWREWFDRYGRARIDPCRGQMDVADYCSKYVTKDDRTWWNLFLKGGLHPSAKKNENLTLVAS